MYFTMEQPTRTTNSETLKLLGESEIWPVINTETSWKEKNDTYYAPDAQL